MVEPRSFQVRDRSTFALTNVKPLNSSNMFKIAEKTTRSCSALSLVVAMTGIGTLRAQLPADSLALWLKADAGVVTSGPTVLEWQDQSGNNRHATASGNVQLVNNIINGHPAVQYFCNNGLLMTPSFQTFPDKRGAIFVVARTLGNSCVSGAGYGAFVQTYYGSGTTWQFGAFPEFYGFYDGVGSSNFNVAALPVNTWGIVTMNRTGNTTMDCYKSGIFSNTVSIADNQPSPNPLRIGASSLSWEVLNGYIAEVIIYNKAMTPAEVEQVNTYLADKYYFNGDVPLPIADDVTICGPGSATLTASGGTAYRWYDSPAATTPVASTASFTTPVLSSTTTYYVEASNGTCPSSARASVVATIRSITPDPGTSGGARCGSGTVTLSATSAQTLIWYSSPGGAQVGVGASFTTPFLTTSTTYYVQATDGFCPSQYVAVQAVINTPPSVFLGNDTTVLATSYQLNAGSGFTGYNWNSGAGTAQTFTVTTPGTYCVVVTDGNGCTATDCIFVDLITGINEQSDWFATVYPNPAHEQLTIRFGGVQPKTLSFRILHMNGQLVQETEHSELSATREISIPLNELAAGAYLLQVRSDRGEQSIRFTVK